MSSPRSADSTLKAGDVDMTVCEDCGRSATESDREGVPLCPSCLRETIIDNLRDHLLNADEAAVPDDVVEKMLDVVRPDLLERFSDVPREVVR